MARASLALVRACVVALALALAGCARAREVDEIFPLDACIGTLESCGMSSAAWSRVSRTEDLDALLPHEAGRTLGTIVARFPLAAGSAAVRVEGGPHTFRLGIQSVNAAIKAIAAGSLEPLTRAVPDGASALLVEVSPSPSRVIWAFGVHAGALDRLEADTSRRAEPALVVAVAAAVLGLLQLVAALERRHRRGSLLVAASALAMAARCVVMQMQWTHWWTLASYSAAHFVEYASIPVIGVCSAAFYRWVAGLDMRSGRLRMLGGFGIACVVLSAIVPAAHGATGLVLKAAQAIAIWSAVEGLLAVRVALHTTHPSDARVVMVGVGTLVTGIAVDLVAAQIPGGNRMLFNIGAIGPAFLAEMACQALLVARRNSRAHDRIDELAVELEATNAAVTSTNALLEVSNAKLADANGVLAAELEERRRLQGELDHATQQLTQAEHMATLGMLMAGIAHDLRNPLNYVQGAAEQLRSAIPELRSDDAALREKTVVRVEKVVGWVEKGTASMDAISLAMRNQARSGGAELGNLVVAEVVGEALLLCRSRTRHCVVETELEETTIRADATGLGQLVMNLVSNAADAIAEARAKDDARPAILRVSARVEGEVFTLTVEDSGTGIPDHVRARILEPFFTTKPRGQGTGLGLAIVQRVVTQHGGTLEIRGSAPLGGTTFEARWPRLAG